MFARRHHIGLSSPVDRARLRQPRLAAAPRVVVELLPREQHALLDVAEDRHDRHVDGYADERALRADNQLRDGDLDVPDHHVVLGVDEPAVEHDVDEHGGHDEREAARETLHARERAVRRAREDAHPQVLVAHVLHRLHAEGIVERQVVVGVESPLDGAPLRVGRQPAVADEVPHLVRLDVVDRDLVEVPATTTRHISTGTYVYLLGNCQLI